MATAQMDTVIRHLRRTVQRQDAAGRTDGQLLATFIDRREAMALGTLRMGDRFGPQRICERARERDNLFARTSERTS